MNKRKKSIRLAACMFAAFAVWTAAVLVIDVRAIGPGGSAVGLAGLNGFVHGLTGVHMPLYVLTDWLGFVPVGCAAGFALLGLTQWIRRKSLRKVDFSILMLGVFYVVVMAAYVFFEAYVVNYRPVLIDGRLEASYPSSTTMLVLCVMPTAAAQLNVRIKNGMRRRFIVFALRALTVFMVAGRLVSGVHWFSDIVGGVLLSAGLTCMYSAFSGME